MLKSTIAVIALLTAGPAFAQTALPDPNDQSDTFSVGAGAGFIPEVLDLSIVDRVITVSGDASLEMARRLARRARVRRARKHPVLRRDPAAAGG